MLKSPASLNLGLCIGVLPSNPFFRKRRWRPALSSLANADRIECSLCHFVAGEDGALALPASGPPDQPGKVEREMLALLSNSGRFAAAGAEADAEIVLVIGSPIHYPTSIRTVFLVTDLDFWLRPGSCKEAERLQAQRATLQALQHAAAFIFLTPSVRRDFEFLFPNWFEQTRRTWAVCERKTSGLTVDRARPTNLLEAVEYVLERLRR
jgi:hypothetical protein